MVLIFVIALQTDQPPKPPSTSQAIVRSKSEASKSKTICADMKEFLTEVKSILFDEAVLKFH